MEGDFRRPTQRNRDDTVVRRSFHVPRPPASHRRPQNIAKSPETPKPIARTPFLYRNKRVLFISVASLLVVAGTLSTFFYLRKESSPLDTYAGRYDFSLYYPTPLPDTYSLKPSSIKASSDLLVFTLVDTSSKGAVIVTQQSRPIGFDVNRSIDKTKTPVSTAVGMLYDLGMGDTGKYMIATNNDTLIFINTAYKLSPEKAQSLAASLKQINR